MPRNAPIQSAYKFLSLSFVSLIAACSNPPDYSDWSHAPSLSDGRSEIQAAELNGTIYVAGGIGKFRMLKSCEAYDIAAQNWAKCPSLPRKLHHVAMATDGEQIFAAGGYVSLEFKHLAQQKLFSLRPDGKTWEAMADLPNPIGEHLLMWASGHLYLIGGSKLDGDTGEVWRFEAGSKTWKKMAPLPTPRNSSAAVVIEKEIWVLGGRSDALGSKIATVEIYNTDTNSWRAGPDMPVGRGGHSAAYLDGKIHVFGGETFNPSKMLDRHDVLDVASLTWSTANPSPKPRHGMAAVTAGDKIYVIGGGGKPAQRTIYSASGSLQIWGE